jgi:hypothetical protein
MQEKLKQAPQVSLTSETCATEASKVLVECREVKSRAVSSEMATKGPGGKKEVVRSEATVLKSTAEVGAWTAEVEGKTAGQRQGG